MLNTLQAAGYEVVVASPCRDNNYREALELQGVRCHSVEPNNSRFDGLVKDFDPQLVIFDRFMIEEQFGWRVASVCPEAVRVLDSVDLHALRRERARISSRGIFPPELRDLNLHAPDFLREVGAILRSDLTIVVSDFELDLLVSSFGISPALLGIWRWYYEVPAALPDFTSRKDLVVIGNFYHPPNQDSVRLLALDLWLKIRRELQQRGASDVTLDIYGAYPSPEFLALENESQGFRVKGWVEDAVTTLGNYRVNLAPLRFGAGIKGKVADGWAAGTPCVGTTIAAEGMCEELPFGGSVTDNWELFVKEVVGLYIEQGRWEEAQRRGLAIIERLFDRERARESLLKMFAEAVSERDKRRQANIFGSILWHNLYRSTEYLSRWIEAKNRG